MAEWSKALRSGRSFFGSKGSNPFPCILYTTTSKFNLLGCTWARFGCVKQLRQLFLWQAFRLFSFNESFGSLTESYAGSKPVFSTFKSNSILGTHSRPYRRLQLPPIAPPQFHEGPDDDGLIDSPMSQIMMMMMMNLLWQRAGCDSGEPWVLGGNSPLIRYTYLSWKDNGEEN